MKAIILAAGMASRLRPLTDNRPKCLLEIGSRSLLQRTIDALIANQINDLVIVTGYLHTQIEDFVASHYPNLPVTWIHNEHYESTNNIYSLWLAHAAVHDTDILLLDSDILFDPQIISELLASPYSNALVFNRHPLGEEEMKIVTDAHNRITAISKTCSIEQAAGESTGIEKMSQSFVQLLFNELEKLIVGQQQTKVFYEVAFENLIREGAEMYAIDTTSLFSMELDTVEDFQQAQQHIPANLY
ncbi:MAG: phosphocholine cytidylyltransferase family protein [Dysgonamonadaceae bacterium]|jgi:choline kinase|nr:phosphocholine cytidylyltransferase family protein [Dysgonamonadaceae bacterium]